MSQDDIGELVELAVAWALAHLGSPDYALRCLAFVEDAYERANQIEVFGGDSAAESAARYGTHPLERAAPPPRGALVFYACGGPVQGEHREWGHVGPSLGDGEVVHAWDRVRVDDIEAVEHLIRADGWSQPRLLGWTAADRVLEGRATRDWAAR
ncbi:MAG: C40 family peptidase [Chloroflexota bacterium]|nr:C40 family peptidase [Chloroflexota bacterium]